MHLTQTSELTPRRAAPVASHNSELPGGRAGPGPRIYNLFPLLFGPVARWVEELPRVAAMGFDWVHVNPFHQPGRSGSLYAIRDHGRLHPLFRGEDQRPDDEILAGFVREAHARGLRVMMDLVIAWTARDSRLVELHPDWLRRDRAGRPAPAATAEDDGESGERGADLADRVLLDYADPASRRGLIAFWSDYIHRHLGLGFDGFRCDAAWMVPADVWRVLIETARSFRPDAMFVADVAAAGADEAAAVAPAGFDYLLNPSKWWDFRSPWLLDRYETLRRLAPSISFPELHDGARLAAELEAAGEGARLAGHARLRYLFAACFATGVMLPAGYEHGFGRRLDSVRTRPADRESPRFDISAFIAAVNRLRAAVPALNEEGPQRRVTAPRTAVVGLLRQSVDGSSCALLLVNADPRQAHPVDAGALMAETGGVYELLEDVTPEREPWAFLPGAPLALGPLEGRLLTARRRDLGPRRELPESEASSEERLRALAARRVTIEDVYPELDAGRHPVKRCVGDVLEVWADIFCDGHDQLAAALRYREPGESAWRQTPMVHYDNDRWTARVPLTRCGRLRYTIEAWRDLFATWRSDFLKKRDAGRDVALELQEGRALLARARDESAGELRALLQALVDQIDAAERFADTAPALLLSDEVGALMARLGPRANLTRYDREVEVMVERTAARFAAWYEMFPRSASGDPARHGTFDDVIARLPYVRDMGFDVLYFPPIHPIGRTHRKGRNNALRAEPGDPGSPYAIGATEGGHTDIHPELGTLDDFRRLVAAARREGLEIALDFAIQCSPDHPWIRQHPEWFDWRPDGTIRHAENPPKTYEDIVNVHFYREALPSIWYAWREVVLFWVEQGVRIFRVDNPHTKPVPFWEWLIAEVQSWYPDVIFLAEAFTRPKMMRKLAKAGFSQSYTYFTWRNTKSELTDYLVELTQHEPREYFRPNLFVNTPDINPVPLQTGGRALFQVRAVLAGTLSSVWGMYSGFELCEATPVPGREEYLNSEKYEIRAWDWDRPGNIRDYIARLNRIRRDNPALHTLTNLRFHRADSEHVLFYGKMTPRRDNIVLVAVNLDPHRAHGCWIELPWDEMGARNAPHVEAEELLTGATSRWYGAAQHIHLDPAVNPCAIWRVWVPEPGPPPEP